MKAADIMSREIPIIDKNQPILAALSIMKKYEIDYILVVEKGQISGVFTYRDLLERLGVQRMRMAEPSRLYVSGVMKDLRIQFSPEDSLRKIALAMLSERQYCAPIIKEGELKGVISRWSFLRALEEFSNISVSSTSRKIPQPLSYTDRVIHARKVLLDNDLCILPVVGESGKLVGLVSEEDLASAFMDFQRFVSWRHQKAQIKYFTVADVLRRETRFFSEDTLVSEASQQLLRERLYGLPVLSADGAITGVFSLNEALTLAAQSFPE